MNVSILRGVYVLSRQVVGPVVGGIAAAVAVAGYIRSVVEHSGLEVCPECCRDTVSPAEKLPMIPPIVVGGSSRLNLYCGNCGWHPSNGVLCSNVRVMKYRQELRLAADELRAAADYLLMNDIYPEDIAPAVAVKH